MEFSTKVNIPQSAFDITHQDKLLLIGSCFTENIGYYLKDDQFQTHVNPFGIIYNPVSIFNNLSNIIENRSFVESDLLFYHELYHSLDHHGTYSGTEKQHVLDKINLQISNANQFFNQSKYIIITLGTAFVYHHKKQNRVAANCHKIPNTEFDKRLLTIEEIIADYNKILFKLKDKIILFTVSPVRHWRDGAVENQRSKSILTESIHQIIAQNENCFYFPAYEIMMDELRDYRYYSEDMLHPNGIAIKYIWERFAETYFNKETSDINKKIEKINLLLKHRIKHNNTIEEEFFNNQKLQSIADFKRIYPEIKVDF